MSRNTLGALLMCLSMFGFAVMDSISKFAVQSYPVTQALWIRYVLYLVFAILVIGPAKVRSTWRTQRPGLQFWRSLLALLEHGVFFLAFAYLPLAETHAIAATSPLIVIMLAAPILGERVGLHRWLAVLAGFGGVLLILRPGFATLSWPMALPLLGAFLWGIYQIMTRLCARYDSSETTLLWSAVIGVVVGSLALPFAWTPPDAMGWVVLFAIGVMGSLCHFGLIKALEYASASSMQPYAYTLLVWASVLGFLVFGDVPAVWTILGGAVVALSGLYTWYRDRA